MKTIILFLFSIFLFSCSQKAKIVYVFDGDTFRLSNNEVVRLAGCDAVELLQPYGLEAKRFAMDNLLNQEIEIRKVDTDAYNRSVSKIRVKGQDFSQLLVSAGFAVVYKRYGSKDLLKRQREARAKKIGIWRGKVTLPYVFRKYNRS